MITGCEDEDSPSAVDAPALDWVQRAEGLHVIAQRLRDDPALLAKAAQLLLDEHFAPSLHEDLLLAVGLEI